MTLGKHSVSIGSTNTRRGITMNLQELLASLYKARHITFDANMRPVFDDVARLDIDRHISPKRVWEIDIQHELSAIRGAEVYKRAQNTRSFEYDFEGFPLTIEYYYHPEERGSYEYPGWPEEFAVESIRFPSGTDVDGIFTPETIEAIKQDIEKQRKMTEWD